MMKAISIVRRPKAREKEERRGREENSSRNENNLCCEGDRARASDRERERRGMCLSSRFSSRRNSFSSRERDIRGGREKVKKKRVREEQKAEEGSYLREKEKERK